eukprot:COSAG03_NODE_618_length_6677_cov_12.024932_6_plen_70_part_00
MCVRARARARAPCDLLLIHTGVVAPLTSWAAGSQVPFEHNHAYVTAGVAEAVLSPPPPPPPAAAPALSL